MMVKPKIFYPNHFSETPLEEMRMALERLDIDIRTHPFT